MSKLHKTHWLQAYTVEMTDPKSGSAICNIRRSVPRTGPSSTSVQFTGKIDRVGQNETLTMIGHP